MNEHSFIFVFSRCMRTRDENKEQLIRQKTIELVVKNGLDGFSMQKLAKAANVSPATLYIYYKDREDLIISICTELTMHMLDDSLKDFDPEMHFDEGLRIQWKNRAAFYMKYTDEVHFIEQIRYHQYYEKVLSNLKDGFRNTMGKFIHNARKRKELAELPFEVYWSIAFAPLYQLIKFHWQGRSYGNDSFALDDKIMMQTLNLVLKALKP